MTDGPSPQDEHLLIAGALGEYRELLAADEITLPGLWRLRARLTAGEFTPPGLPPGLGVQHGILRDWCARRLLEHGAGTADDYVKELITAVPDDASGLDGAP